ncbi:MAG: hypothetical protein SNJ74_05075 [Fimbriimonadaceae bacterium]
MNLLSPGPWVVAACTAGLALSGYAVRGLEPEIVPPVPPPTIDAEDYGAASLLGQFRTSASGWLWLRADLYLHNGVEMRRLTSLEERSGRQGVGSAEGEGDLHDDSKIVTVIPPADRDYRGILGEVERATKAYKDMSGHGHNNPEQSLPLFRLMTWIDPHFVMAWTTGGAVIARDRSERGTEAAIAFLREGLEKNPVSIAIRTEIARLLIRRKGDLAGARELLEDAVKTGYDHRDRISEVEGEALNQAYRWLALVYRETGDPQRCVAVASQGLAVYPDDGVLEHLATPMPLVLGDEAAKKWGLAVRARLAR